MDYISFVKNKKVYIWGAWEIGCILDNELSENGIEVVAYVDGKKIEAERFYNNRKLLSAHNVLPEILKIEDAIVLVACAEHDAIKETLEEYGFEEGRNMLYLGNEINVSSSSKYYEDFYGNLMISTSAVPQFTIGMKATIRIGKNVKFGKNVRITSWGYSEIVIEDNVTIGDNCRIEIRDDSKIYLGKNMNIEEDVHIRATRRGNIYFGAKCLLSRYDDVFVTGGSKIDVGENTYFSQRDILRFYSNTIFTCGKNCAFSNYVKIRGENGHTIIDLDEKKVKVGKTNVCVADHVWVGMGVTLLGGTIINRDSIVGADSLISKEFPPNSMIAGTPAKIIKENVDWDYRPNVTYEEWEQKRNK